MKMKDCIFCNIANGKIPSKKVYEDKDSFAFLDIDPITIGHTILVPKKHFKTIADMSPDELCKIAPAIEKISKAIMKLADGMNIGQNNNKVAGQVVDHVHFHLIPRYKNDKSGFFWKHTTRIDEKHSDEFLKKIKGLL